MDKIFDRIQKLLALSKSDNVNEAASAAAEAQRLMLQHKIEAADLELRGADHVAEPVGEELLEGTGDKKKSSGWRVSLAGTLSRAFNSHAYFHFKSDKIFIVGRHSDVQTIRYLMAYLSNEIERLCDRDWKDLIAGYKAGDYDDLSPPNAKAWRNSFKLGAVSAIEAKLVASHKAVESNEVLNRSSAMVLVKKHDEIAKAEVEKKIKNMKLRAVNRTVSTPDAWKSGVEAGSSLDVNSNNKAIGPSKKQLT
jgi:hypothetical protein